MVDIRSNISTTQHVLNLMAEVLLLRIYSSAADSAASALVPIKRAKTEVCQYFSYRVLPVRS